MSIINDKLGGDESLLEMLYHFLEQSPPLNPLLASFFSKTIGNLIARKTEQVGRPNGDHGGLFSVPHWPILTASKLLFAGHFLPEEKRGLHRPGAESHRRVGHDGSTASPHQLCRACPLKTGGPRGELSLFRSLSPLPSLSLTPV